MASDAVLGIDAAIRNFVSATGGHRQRLCYEPRPQLVRSATGQYLSEEWTWGRIEATRCEEHTDLTSLPPFPMS